MNSITSPRRLFAIISLLMIVVMLTATGFTQAPFFRQAIMDREAVIVRDMVNALVVEHGLSASDLDSYDETVSRLHLNQSFNALKSLSDVVHIKVFNRDDKIAWSDDSNLLGTKRTAHMEHLTRAMHGKIEAVFNPAKHNSNVFDQGPAAPATIEFYVPLLPTMANQSAVVIGVLSLYRSPDHLNETIRHGLYLLWAIIGAAGLILFVALFTLFNKVYSRQKNAELQFSKLTAEHQRIVQLEKLSAMGALVGEIAHQLNNPLVGVLNLTQLAEREAEDPQRVKELLAEVRKAGIECRDIIQRILRINQISRSEPQAHLMAKWRAALPNDNLRVGLVWKGNPKFENDAERSLASLDLLAPLGAVKQVCFISLQKGAGEDEAKRPPVGLSLVHLGSQMTDFADAAAIVANLDLVICVDTAIAHLTAALGKPCWLLLPDYMTDWRWLSEGAGSLWYPGVMRIFRQPQPGDWTSVVAEVVTALEDFACARLASTA